MWVVMIFACKSAVVARVAKPEPRVETNPISIDAAVPDAPVAPIDRAAICPGKLNAGIAEIDMHLVIASLPKESFRFRLEWANVMQTKTGGVWSSRAHAGYARDRERIEVVVEDMIHRCTGAPGTESVLLATEEIDDPKARRREADDVITISRSGIIKRRGVIIEWGRPAERNDFVMWIHERCRMTLRGNVQAGGLTILLEQADWDTLDRLCKAR